MREAGARTLVQDQATSLIWGMPRVAAELGAAEYQVPLDDVAAKALSLAHDRDRKREREASGERDGEH
jgi:two-component system chemotaxis response regulator CheB